MLKIALFWGMIILLGSILGDAFFVAKAKNPRPTSRLLQVVAIVLLIVAINVYFFPTAGVSRLLINILT